MNMHTMSWCSCTLHPCSSAVSRGSRMLHAVAPSRGFPACYICVPLPILSLSGVDRHDYLSPSFSVLCELWVELVLFQIAPHSGHPPQSGPSPRSLPSHLHCCYMLCNVRVFSSHRMAMPRKAFLGDICGDWLEHCIDPELFISDSFFPCFALNPS